MSGSKVHRFSTLLSVAQRSKQLLHFNVAMLLVLLLICCCHHHHQSNAIKLFPIHEHDPENSKLVSYDGNLPEKFFSPISELQSGLDWQIKERVQRFDSEGDVTDDRRTVQISSASNSVDQMVAEASTDDGCKEQEKEEEKKAKGELLPRRERRFNWDRWIHWFRPPSERTSMGFMPVRGRKTTFIAARGKKSTGADKSAQMHQEHNHNHKHSAAVTAWKGKTRYFLVALTVKPLLRSAALSPDAVLEK